jgi:DNA (cytosine-5)-methyltransferase 1
MESGSSKRKIIKKMLTHISFFSGIGGFELGAQRVKEIKNFAAIEKNKFCCDKLRKNFPSTIIYEKDIRTINPKEEFFSSADIYSAGFPCQDISLSGKGKGINGDKSSVFFKFFEFICCNRPKYVLLENSPAILIRGFEKILCAFSQVGYNVEWTCLQASDFGYPHKRERFVAVAYTYKNGRTELLQKLKEIMPVSTFQQAKSPYLSTYTKNVHTFGDYFDLCGIDGFPTGFSQIIMAYGNAIVVEMAEYLFRCVKKHYYENYENK